MYIILIFYYEYVNELSSLILSKKIYIFNNYSLKSKWIAADIYLRSPVAAS